MFFPIKDSFYRGNIIAKNDDTGGCGFSGRDETIIYQALEPMFVRVTPSKNPAWSLYPLVNVYITMENHIFLMGKLTIKMAMFNSYVSLPEGIWCPILIHIKRVSIDQITSLLTVLFGIIEYGSNIGAFS